MERRDEMAQSPVTSEQYGIVFKHTKICCNMSQLSITVKSIYMYVLTN